MKLYSAFILEEWWSLNKSHGRHHPERLGSLPSGSFHSVSSTSVAVCARSHQSSVAVLSHYSRCAGVEWWTWWQAQ